MTEECDRKSAATLARLTANFLATGEKLGVLSVVLTVLGLTVLLLTTIQSTVLPGLIFSIMFGIAGIYFSMRVAIDRRIFLHWAESWEHSPDADPVDDMVALDMALSSIRRNRSAQPLTRSLPDRQQGARGLLKRLAIAVTLQCTLLIISALVANFA